MASAYSCDMNQPLDMLLGKYTDRDAKVRKLSINERFKQMGLVEPRHFLVSSFGYLQVIHVFGFR
jgi:hypothetical protein